MVISKDSLNRAARISLLTFQPFPNDGSQRSCQHDIYNCSFLTVLPSVPPLQKLLAGAYECRGTHKLLVFVCL